ncbi:MAG TPA: large conductance mechanosensitive channel protein MscL, partial [Candidatus Polarisedimenticolia bacterium]|nr:large conductance mechanosensitive channel protein MscL [Candidatus Polarisedimenticolia bacterium]
VFLNTAVDFFIVALCVYLIGRIAMKPAPTPPGPAMKECPQCGEQILAKAKKCKHCTSPV